MQAESQGQPNRNGESAPAAADDETRAVSSVSGLKESEWVLGAATNDTHAERSKGTTSFTLSRRSVILLRAIETVGFF